jgi:molecular chaperone GrpE
MTDNEMKEELSVEERLAECEQRAEEYLAGWKRAKADLENVRKNEERMRNEFARFAAAAVMRDLLPVIDTFRIALAHLPENVKQEQWAVGLTLLDRQLEEALRAQGVERMETVGKPMDPEYAEAVGSEKGDPNEPGVVLREAQTGYLLHGKVLRPAKVIVSE